MSAATGCGDVGESAHVPSVRNQKQSASSPCWHTSCPDCTASGITLADSRSSERAFRMVCSDDALYACSHGSTTHVMLSIASHGNRVALHHRKLYN